MHPGQYTLLNSPKENVHQNSIKDLKYHADVLDLMGLNASAKIQIHVGGVYGDKETAISRFISKFEKLDQRIKKRIVVENDEKSFSIQDCIRISHSTGVPIVFDSLHHDANNNQESYHQAMKLCTETWHRKDGVPIVDYSSQEPNSKLGKHALSIDSKHFRFFLEETKPYDFDIMLEIKDKETSALKAISIGIKDDRFSKKLP
jgi:UV DNA damage endonuclease